MKYAANPQRVLSFILITVRDFIVKRTKLISAISNSLLGKIRKQVTEYFSKRMLWDVHWNHMNWVYFTLRLIPILSDIFTEEQFAIRKFDIQSTWKPEPSGNRYR